MTKEQPTRIPWPPLLLVAAFAAAWILHRQLPLPWPGLDDWPARAVGIGFGIVGVALIFWSIRTLQQHETTFLPHRQSDALVTSGPYRIVRNPIYLGDVFVLFGLAEISKNIWLVIAAIAFAAAVTWLSILPEEAHLEAHFGDKYREYKAKTRRWI